MHACCPPSQGCNAAGADQACALKLCRAASSELKDAQLAVERWQVLESTGDGKAGRRFRRRAYERARDRALITLALGGGRSPRQLRPRRRSRRAVGRLTSAT